MTTYIANKSSVFAVDDRLTERDVVYRLMQSSIFREVVPIVNEYVGEKRSYLIAGGFLRDIVLFREIEDIDVFVVADQFPDEMEKYESSIKSEYDYENVGNYAGDLKFKKAGYNFNLVMVRDNTLNKVIEQFPITLSWIGFNGHEFIVSDLFLISVNEKVLYMTSTPTDKYLSKIKKKFPNYKLP